MMRLLSFVVTLLLGTARKAAEGHNSRGVPWVTREIVTRLLTLIALCSVAAAFAQTKPPIWMAGGPDTTYDPAKNWVVEFITSSGEYSRIGEWYSKEACETEIPRILREQAGFDGRCIQFLRGHKIGSQDPKIPQEWK